MGKTAQKESLKRSVKGKGGKELTTEPWDPATSPEEEWERTHEKE